MRVIAFLIILFLGMTSAWAGPFDPPLGLSDEGGTESKPVFQLDCVGAGISCAQSGTTGTITVGGGGSGNSFETLDVPAGTDPVADSSTDIATFTEDTFLTLTGTAATDTIAITQVTTDLGTDGLIAANAVALTTDTTGNYAAGDAEAGAALTGDSATSFFSTGTLEVGIGGTGAATLTDGGILLGSGTGAITALGVAANGQIPIGDGTTDPVLATITGTVNQVTVTNGAGTITLSTPQDIATTSTPTFGNLILAGAGADIRWNPTSGDSFHAGAEYNATTGTSIWLLSNVTDAKHYLVIDNAHQFEFPQYDCSTLGSGGKLTVTAAGKLICAADETAAGGAGDLTDVNEGTAIDVTNPTGPAPSVAWDSTEVEATTWGAGGNASNAWTFNLSGTDPVLTASSNTLTVTGDLASSGIAGPEVTVTPTGGVAAGMHAELHTGSNTLFSLKNGVRWILEESPQSLTIGGKSDSASVPFIVLKTTGTGDGALTVPANSIGGGEVLTTLSDRSAGFICPAGLSTDEDCEEVRVYIPSACIVQRVEMAVTTAPTGAALIGDILECTAPGTCTSIDTGTKPQIAAGAFSGSDTTFTDTSLAAGNYLALSITQVGSTVAGSDLTVVVVCRF